MWASEELDELMAKVTPRQAQGIIRIVQAELAGASIYSLLHGPDKICTWKTYHGSGKSRGWKNKETFNAALHVARRDYRAWMLENGTQEALTTLAATAPEAAKLLQQRVIGDGGALDVLVECLKADAPEVRSKAAMCMGQTGLPHVVAALSNALDREKDMGVARVIIESLGMIASGAARDIGAADDVLDRAAAKTASKGTRAVTGPEGGPLQHELVPPDFSRLADDEIEALANILDRLEG